MVTCTVSPEAINPGLGSIGVAVSVKFSWKVSMRSSSRMSTERGRELSTSNQSSTPSVVMAKKNRKKLNMQVNSHMCVWWFELGNNASGAGSSPTNGFLETVLAIELSS